MSEVLVTASAVSHEIGDRQILERIDLTIHSGQRIALVGPNGSGKSTLLRLLAGLEQPTGGDIERIRGLRVGWLPQITAGGLNGNTVREELAARTGVAAAQGRMDRETRRLTSGDLSGIEAHSEAVEEWARLGGQDLDSRVGKGLSAVGLDPDWADRSLGSLSGGQLARINLATLHLSRLDLALLDEPGNHLDAEGLEMLGRLAPESASAVILASHDRHLLEGFAVEVLELERGRSRHFRGGWQTYMREKQAEHEKAMTGWEQAAGEKRRLVEMERRIREQAAVGERRARGTGETDKFIRHMAIASAQKNTAAGGIAKRIRHLEVPEKPWQESFSTLLLDATQQAHSPRVAVARELVIAREGWRSKPVSLSIAPGERLLLTGPNGSGKSSLIGALAGRIKPASGSIEIPARLRIVELAQQGSVFATPEGVTGDREVNPAGPAAISLIESFRHLSGLDETSARTALAAMKLGPDQAGLDPARLSPGERTRAELALLARTGAACLLLDEPGNHLDIEALEVLEKALAGWSGALVVASHDPAFCEAIRFDRTVDLDS